MIHTVNDFFNKTAEGIKQHFFPDADWQNEAYCKAKYAIELFNNGCLTYKVFIGRLAKACGSNNATIHNIVEKYIVSFGQYQYKPRRLYSEAKKQIS